MSMSIPFIFIAAFTSESSPFSGNPAAIVIRDINTPTEIQSGLAKNFNQPMTVFVNPVNDPSLGQTVVSTDIRFIASNGIEVELCGHGTLAAAKAILSQPAFIKSDINTISFQTRKRGIVQVKKLAEDSFEIEFPSAEPTPVSEERQTKLLPIINRAFGREVVVKHITNGGKGFEILNLIELDEKENLGGSIVNPEAFRESGYIINVITTESSSKDTDEVFVSRMFSPTMAPGGEDPVCGFAHCVLAPYWYRKKGITPGKEITAKQVSPRGGILRVIWDEEKRTVKLRGDAIIFATGNFQL